jgi:hypothetical protein
MRSASSGELAELVKDLRAQVAVLEPHLTREAADDQPTDTRLHVEYAEARKAKRTAAGYDEWLEGRVTQTAAAWVLATVVVRYCEDNELIDHPLICGPGERYADAEDRYNAWFRQHAGQNDTAYLVDVLAQLSATHPTVASLFDERHNPLWDIPLRYEAAAALLAFWRRRGPDAEVQWHFDGWDTRFLGDLYQDLSEFARKQYALLQTPEFVEEFILDLTLNPAIEEFGLEGLRAIDPTAGSGHFVLGLFDRILTAWRAAEPGTHDWELIRRALNSVHGVDKNPFAVFIARFRLLVAVLEAARLKRLDAAPDFPINLAVGDSLIHGRGAPRLQRDASTIPGLEAEPQEFAYSTEDIDEFDRVQMLKARSYHVVVGNPPYITVKDKGQNESYRRYSACSGKYALSVPFAQRFFGLAVKTGGDDRHAGFVGQITANSFMKREFGKKLIEEFFAGQVHLTHIIDTSGAYIPGHGTPTVVLIGRNHLARMREPVHAVLGVRGEPDQPANPAEGRVWKAIVDATLGSRASSDWVSVEEADRRTFAYHPWSVAGGGAGDLTGAIIASAASLLRDVVSSVGITCFTLEDEVYVRPLSACRRAGIGAPVLRGMIEGDGVRDWKSAVPELALFPYDANFSPLALTEESPLWRPMWPYRSNLSRSVMFGGLTKVDSGLSWWEYGRLTASKLKSKLAIAFAEVSTHNHFVLSRGGALFKQTAPVVKLSEESPEDDHLELLGLLNSSTACFWLKQVCHDKGIRGEGGGFTPSDWERFYQFNGTNVSRFPLPRVLPLELGRELDRLAQKSAAQEPSALCGDLVPQRVALSAARRSHERLRQRMIALQEELDWTVYRAYDLLSEAEAKATTVPELIAVPEVQLGERAFEIVLARQVSAGEVETAWFTRHGSTPVTEIPERWPQAYRDVVQARIDLIDKRPDLALIERPECKRRWSTVPWKDREASALRGWLLDRCERRDLWYGLRDGFVSPRPMTVSQLADRFRDDEDMLSVGQLYAADHLDRRDATLADVLEAVIATEHVPYLAALRYKDSGLVKRAAWEKVWSQQREEDRTGERLDIAVPPKYGPTDFRKPAYWSQRGKLDVPKERFISYPDASPDADPTLLLGWAGWDHKDQAAALVGLVTDRATDAGWGADRLTPLLAGLLEVLPWVRQWHGTFDAEWGGDPAEDIATFLAEERSKLGLSEDALRAWRPQPARRGRRTAGTGGSA